MPGLPKKYAKMGFKKGWAAYKRSKGRRKNPVRKTKSRLVRKTPRRKGRSRARQAVKSAGPLIGFGTFVAGSMGGEWATDTKIRPWMSEKGWGEATQGIALILAAYATRRFTNKRGIKNAGLGASAYMAAKGGGMLLNTIRAGGMFGG